MTPQDVAFLEGAAKLIQTVGAWPVVGIILLIVIGPWVMALLLDRAQERRLRAVADMYEHNVELVKEGQRLSQRLCKLDEDLQGVIMLNAQAMTRLTDAIQGIQGLR